MVRHTAVNSTADGSVVIGVDFNISDAEKELAKLKKSIAKLEKDIIDATSERDKAIEKRLSAEGILDAEKAKLEDLKRQLYEFQDIAKDKGVNIDTREQYKAMIPDIKQDISEQSERVRSLQTEFNQIDASVEKYTAKINDATAQVVYQKNQAGELQQQIDEANEAVSQMAVADQHVVDINKELLSLKKRQKELSQLGVGLGFEEFDRNAARIAEINQELKDYQKTIAEINADGPVMQETGPDLDERRAEILEKQQAAIARVSEQLHALNALVSEISSSIGTKLSTAFAPLAEKLAPSIGRIKAGITEAFRPLAEKIDLGAAKKSIEIGLDAIKNAFSRFAKRIAPDLQYAAGSVAIGFESIFHAIKNIPQKLGAAFSGLKGFANVGGQIKGLSVAFRAILDNASNAAKAIGNFGIVASKSFLSAAKNALAFAAKFNIFSKLSDGLTKKFSRLGQMIRRVFVFSVITSGLRAIRSQLSGYLKVNAEFMTALRRLQGVFLTAFQPIYDVIVPALTTLINVLARAAAMVSSFFASLFGTTAKQAQANAKSLYEQANATAAAGGAAEEASKQLAGFDEIEKLEGSKSGGGGGGGGVETGPLFEFEYDETPFESWGEAFSAFLDKLLAGIPKLREAFKNFADWLNDFNKNLYEMFTFPGVMDKVKQLGRDLAKAFDDLAEWIDWEGMGRALGAGFKLAIEFLDSFIYGGDSGDDSQWKRLGKHLAEAVNGLVDEIGENGWYDFGRLLWGGFKIGLETCAGFIENLNMPIMAKAASNVVMGFFDEMTNTINRISWDKIGLQIAAFLTNLKWGEMFDSIYKAIQSALEGILGLLTGFLSGLGEWTEPLIGIVNTVIDTIEKLMDLTREWASSINLQPIADAFGNLLTAIDKLVGLISDGLLWAYENVLLPLGTWVIEEAAPVALNFLAEAIAFLTAVLEKLSPIAQFIWTEILQPLAGFAWTIISGALEVITNILEKLTNLLTGNTSFSDFIDSLSPGEAIILGITAALLGLNVISTIAATVSAAGGLISFVLTDLQWTLAALTSPVGLVVAAIGLLAAGFVELYKHSESFRNFIDGIIEGAKELIPGIIQGISDGWHKFTEWLSELWQSIVDGFKDFFGIHSPSTLMAEMGGDLIDGLLQGISQAWTNIVQFFSDAWEGIKSFLTDTWENLKTAATEKFTEIKDKIGEAWDNIKQKTSEIWEGLKNFVSETWENLKNWASEKFEAVKESISKAWETVKSKTTEIWDGIKNSISETWNNLVSWAKEKFDAIKEKISTVWENVKTVTSTTWENLKSTLSTTWENLKTAVKEKFEEIKKNISEAWEKVKTATHDAWEAAKSTVSSALSNIWDTVTSTFSNLVSSALKWGKDLCQNIADGIGNGIRKVKDAVKDVADTIKDFVGFSEPKKGPLSNFHTFMPDMLELMSDGIRDNTYMATKAASELANNVADALNRRTYTLGNINLGRMPDFSNMRIPKLAQGAVIPPNREFMAVLGDQKHGNNIEAPVSEIESAVSRALRTVGMGGGGNITVVMEIDGREFGRASYKYGTAEQQRVGVRMTEAHT